MPLRAEVTEDGEIEVWILGKGTSRYRKRAEAFERIRRQIDLEIAMWEEARIKEMKVELKGG